MPQRDTKPTPAAGARRGTLTGLPAAPRRPQQERGQRRFDAILDATAGLVAEEGVSGVTMNAIAKRSSTTVGSLYHFFPDRDAVYLALLERHGERIGERFATLETLDWSALTVEQSVTRFVDVVFSYILEFPDLMPLAAWVDVVFPAHQRHEGPEELLLRVTGRMIAAHAHGAAPADRAAHTAMVMSAIEGAIARWQRERSQPPEVVQRELERMLVAYLCSFA